MWEHREKINVIFSQDAGAGGAQRAPRLVNNLRLTMSQSTLSCSWGSELVTHNVVYWGPEKSSSSTREGQGLTLGHEEPVVNLGLQTRNQRRWKHLLTIYWPSGTVPRLYLIFKTIFRGHCYCPNFIDRERF